MKILHLFPNDKFTESYIEFVNKNFDPNEHLFLIIGKGIGAKITPRENVKELLCFKSMLILLKEIYKCKKILLHGLFSKEIVILLFIQPWLLKKCNWIVWGADLYKYKNRKRNFKNDLYEFIRKIVIKNVNEISTLVKEDYDLAKKWYSTKAKHYKAIYLGTEKTKVLNKIIENNLKNDFNSNLINKKYSNIQIGNSATSSNNHMEVLDLLKKYKNENIRIYCPLSYGDLNYAEKVINYGNKIYGDKFIPLKNFLSMKEYMELLNTIDVGIFNNDRQQALGNIYSLLYLGKKIYMRESTSMWKEMHNDLQLKIFSIDNLKEEEFDIFIYLQDEYRKSNQDIVKLRYDKDNIKFLWSEIFNVNK